MGFESQSKNRGRAEKSRLKKEVKLNENPAAMAAAQAMVKIKMKNPKTGKENSAVSALKDKDNPNHKKAKSIFSKLKDRFSKKKKEEPKKQSKSDTDFYKRQYAGESVSEGKFGKFDTGAAFKGNGMTIYDRNQEKSGDFKNIAHIGNDGKITIWDKNIKKEAKLMQSLNKISQEFKTSFKESKVNEVESKTMKTIGSIIGRKQAQKISGVLVDMQTAHVIMKVWNALGSSNRAKFEKLPIKQMANVAWKLMK